MRRFCFIGFAVIFILCCCSFLFAQEKVKYQEFVEVEIIPNDALSISDIEALPKAPGSSIETLDNGTVRVQIPKKTVQQLADSGATIRTIRNFILVQPQNLASASQPNQTIDAISYEFGENDTDVPIPSNGDFTGSGIDLTSRPANIITSVDVHYEVESYSIVYVEMSDSQVTETYSLVDGEYGSVNQTETGIATFNGMTLNKTWVLWARENYSSGDGFIDFWWIKLYYNSGSSYCSATTSSTAYEYISRVLVGSINNSTGSSGYADYTSLSTTMDIGTGYPITVNNGRPYSSDGCAIWVDWNQDKDFDDAGETISVSGSPGIGPYTATITPPAGALIGNTRMRVRIVDTGYNTLMSCGTASYGEVEDYTINVNAPAQTLKVSGHITLLGDGSPLAGVLLEIYNGTFPNYIPSGLTDISDANGYYEIEVPSPWTGYVDAQKEGYVFSLHTAFENVTTDQIQNFGAHYSYSGGIGTENSPYLIATTEDMNAVGSHPEDWSRHFKVIADINLSGFTGSQFKIIGTDPSNAFTGVFDGQNHIVSNFTYLAKDRNNVGLFGFIGTAGRICNVRMENVNIYWSGSGWISGLVGALAGVNGGLIFNCSSSGRTAGSYDIGGLVGANGGTISRCFSTAAVKGEMNMGGLIGYNNPSAGLPEDMPSSTSADVNNCYAKGPVSGNFAGGGDYVGGFVGANSSGHISKCYAIGSVSGSSAVGQFVGANSGGGTITGCFGGSAATKDINTYLNASWDFIWENMNGTNDYWRMCVDEPDYPRLTWEYSPADFVCPDGVDWKDLLIFCDQWLLEKLSADIKPDGIVNFLDFAEFANSWQGDAIQLSEFSSQWLKSSAYCADIAPAGGDGVVNFLDFAVFAENWLKVD
jgi:hypothetical protein